jgi:hypothetical protein
MCRMSRFTGALAIFAAFMAGSLARAEVPALINYQGRLVDAAGAPLPGAHTVVFRIYDAVVGGVALWTETQPVTADSAGVISAILGGTDPFPGDLFDGARWLEVEVDGEVLVPRRLMASVPFAFRADVCDSSAKSRDADMLGGQSPDAFADSAHSHNSLRAADGFPAEALYVDTAGRVGIGTKTMSANLKVYEGDNVPLVLDLENPNTGANASERIVFSDRLGGIAGIVQWNEGSSSPNAMKIFNNRPGGTISLGTGVPDQVVLKSGNLGIGTLIPSERLEVAGTAKVTGLKMPTGAGAGRVLTSDAAGAGTWQTPASNPDADWTIAGSDMYSAVSGKVGIGTTTPGYKLQVSQNSTGALAYPLKVENAGPSTNGTATGILFKVDSGENTRGKGAIVYEQTDTWNRGDFHILQSRATATTAPASLADAVLTIKNSGRVGIGTKLPGAKLEVRDSVSTMGAVQALNNMRASGVGLLAAGNDEGPWTNLNGCGIAGTGLKWGVQGVAVKDSGEAGAMLGVLMIGGGLYNQARLCYRSPAGTQYKVNGDGLASTIMSTSKGRVNLACPESPEPWIEDYGSGEIEAGTCHIELDPVYLDCITVDGANPLKVFVQLTSPMDQQYYVKKGQTGFDVTVAGPGSESAGATFDYKVVGKWRGNEHFRFEKAPEPTQAVEVSRAPVSE